MTMPFGKYKGLAVKDLPTEYLQWLFVNIELRGRLRVVVCGELDQRAREQSTTQRKPSTVTIQVRPDDVPMARQVFDLGYRAAARTLHPDAGGDSETMVRLNALAQSVRSQLATLEAGA